VDLLLRFLGCVSQDCLLCKNNPHKTCGTEDNFDEAYADNQVLRARCEAEIFVDLINQVTGEVYSAPGVEVQVGMAADSAAAAAATATAAAHGSEATAALLAGAAVQQHRRVCLQQCVRCTCLHTQACIGLLFFHHSS
jgi:hypothetical protein